MIKEVRRMSVIYDKKCTIIECVCPKCKRKAWLRKIKAFGYKYGWLCTRCKNWWTE